VHEILTHLQSGSRVLDLGCRQGSFSLRDYPDLFVVALDIVAFDHENAVLDEHLHPVQADASRLPFAERSFDAIVANHSLEHMTSLSQVMREVGRVVKPTGSLFVSVPDASTFSDSLYRWVYHGGGHVNPFRSSSEVAKIIVENTGLQLAGTRLLHTSFLFLRREHFSPRPPRRMWLFFNGGSAVIRALAYAARIADRLFGTRLSVYGWALYFSAGALRVDTRPLPNVCLRCGGGFPESLLIEGSAIRRRAFLPDIYRCPTCGECNFLTWDPDRHQ
jgi:SAM-dependent methyltransferase